MKKFLFIILSALPLGLLCQTIVSTSPQNKNVVLEEFTGINCGYCPQGHAIANSISSSNPGRVVVINIHVGNFATPGAGQPDFRTSFGTSIANQSGLTGYPAGTVNRHVFSGLGMSTGSTAMGRGNWTNASNQILAQSSYVNIGATAEIDFQNRLLTIYVEAYYTANSPVNANKLNIALMQNNTFGPQSGASTLPYNHMHRLVHMITGQWGSEISKTTSGTLYTNTFTYTIPAHYNNIPALLEDMELGVFVSEGNQEVITGIKVTPEIKNKPDVYFFIESATNPSNLISYSFTPKVTVKSYGNETLNTLNLSYKINEEDEVNYTWEGTLDFGQKTEITLPITPWYLLKPTNTLKIEILSEDENVVDNIITHTFSKAPISILNDLTVEVRTDQYGSEITWNIKNSSNAIVSNGGPYTNAVQTQTKNVNLPDGIYTLTINDSYGDGILGGGYIKLKNANGDLFTILGNSYTSSASRAFKVTKAGEVSWETSNEVLSNGSIITINSEKILVEPSWILIDNNNVSNYISLISNDSKAEIQYTVNVEPLNKKITITIDEAFQSGTTVQFGFGDGLLDEDGLNIQAISHIFQTTSIGNNQLFSATLFPNPNSGQFSISIPNVSERVDVKVINAIGATVMEGQHVIANGKIDVNISQPKGVYFVTLTPANGQKQTLKLVID